MSLYKIFLVLFFVASVVSPQLSFRQQVLQILAKSSPAKIYSSSPEQTLSQLINSPTVTIFAPLDKTLPHYFTPIKIPPKTLTSLPYDTFNISSFSFNNNSSYTEISLNDFIVDTSPIYEEESLVIYRLIHPSQHLITGFGSKFSLVLTARSLAILIFELTRLAAGTMIVAMSIIYMQVLVSRLSLWKCIRKFLVNKLDEERVELILEIMPVFFRLYWCAVAAWFFLYMQSYYVMHLVLRLMVYMCTFSVFIHGFSGEWYA